MTGLKIEEGKEGGGGWEGGRYIFLNMRWDSQTKLSGPRSPLLAVFVVTDSMSLLLSAVFRFLTSFGVNFDTLCASSNLSILSRLFDFFWHTTVHSILL